MNQAPASLQKRLVSGGCCPIGDGMASVEKEASGHLSATVKWSLLSVARGLKAKTSHPLHPPAGYLPKYAFQPPTTSHVTCTAGNERANKDFLHRPVVAPTRMYHLCMSIMLNCSSKSTIQYWRPFVVLSVLSLCCLGDAACQAICCMVSRPCHDLFFGAAESAVTAILERRSSQSRSGCWSRCTDARCQASGIGHCIRHRQFGFGPVVDEGPPSNGNHESL